MCRRQDHLRRAASIGQGFFCSSGGGKHGGDAGNNLARNLCLLQRFNFFACASKDHRIAALQSHHARAIASLTNHQLVNLLLRDASAPATFPHTDDLRVVAGAVENGLRNQVVMQHHIRPRQQIRSLQRQQFRIAWPGTHQIHSSLLRCRPRRLLLRPTLRKRQLSRWACIRTAHRTLGKCMQQRLALTSRWMRRQNFAPQMAELIEPLRRVRRQLRVNLSPQPLRQRRTFASR